MGTADRKAREWARREDEILSAALSLFERDDWQQVTADEIAERAEVGKGTLYRHFPSKDEIYARLVLRAQRERLEVFRQVDTRLPILDRLRALFRAYWQAMPRDPALQRLFLYTARYDFRHQLSAETAAELEALEDAIYAINLPMLEEGLREGVLREQSLPLLQHLVQAALYGGARWWWTGRAAELDEATYFEAMTDLIIRGISRSPE
ncbi:MAG: TetR/AcrR family transcriptional regulator [Gammaproteobacteria bacterium]|jgi:AcrR family transcriptional regulator